MDNRTRFGKACDICSKSMNGHSHTKCSEIRKAKYNNKENKPSKRKALSTNSQEYLVRQIHKFDNANFAF